jgi:hypothetical protein
MLLNKCELNENWYCKSHSSWNGVNTIQSSFYNCFRFGWSSVQRCPQNFRAITFFVKIGAVKVIQACMNVYPILANFSGKWCMRDLHMVLVSVCDFQGNLLGRTVLFVWAVYILQLRVYRETVQHPNAQNALIKSVYCVRKYTLCNLISLYSIHRLHLLMEAHHALSAVRTEVLYIMHFNFSL